jgi:hypothetical protein
MMKNALSWYKFWVTLGLIVIAAVLSSFLTFFSNSDELADLLNGYEVKAP